MPTAHTNDSHAIWFGLMNHKQFVSVCGVNRICVNITCWMITSDQDSLDTYVWSDDHNDKLLVRALKALTTSHPIIWIDQWVISVYSHMVSAMKQNQLQSGTIWSRLKGKRSNTLGNMYQSPDKQCPDDISSVCASSYIHVTGFHHSLYFVLESLTFFSCFALLCF